MTMNNPLKNNTPEAALVMPGYVGIDEGDQYWTADIDIGDHAARVQCYGETAEDARQLRDQIIAALSQPQHGGLVEAARVVDAVVGSNADGCVSASAAYQKCCQAARAALSNSPVVGEDYNGHTPNKYIPPLPKGTNLFAVNPSTGDFAYINHAGTWQGMPNPLPKPTPTDTADHDDEYESALNLYRFDTGKDRSRAKDEANTNKE